MPQYVKVRKWCRRRFVFVMSEPVYDLDYFIAKFEAIPAEKWCRNVLVAEVVALAKIAGCGWESAGLDRIVRVNNEALDPRAAVLEFLRRKKQRQEAKAGNQRRKAELMKSKREHVFIQDRRVKWRNFAR